jgi:small subunit ribosomal protein S4
MKKITQNRKIKKIHQAYLRYGDIWGLLGQKKRDNYVTRTVSNNIALPAFKRILRRSKLTAHAKKRIWKNFRTRKKYTRVSAFQINTKSTQKRKRTSSRRGLLLKLRRQISLFYTGGKIRRKTFRRYGRIFPSSYKKKSYTEILESRLDVLLFRSNFVDSVYKARHFILNRKVHVHGYISVNVPGLILQNFQLFCLNDTYTRNLRLSLYTKLRKHTMINLPSYLFINFALLFAFKIEDPKSGISYPFSANYKNIKNFRGLFRFL